MKNVEKTKSYRIIVIGAGISGILMATYLKTKLKSDDFLIVEARKDVGGTWLVNKYPGAACDVESHLYSLYSNLNPNWSINFAGQEEIQEYWQNLVKVHNIRPKIQFSSTVKNANFNEESKKWELQVDKEDSEESYKLECDILIGGVGYLRIPNIPKVFSKFKGPIMHSAQWNSEIELEGKVVGVVGSGASAVQIVPNIIDKVKELHTFQRNPPWVIPRFRANYSSIFKFLLNWIPGFNKIIYWQILLTSDLILYPAFIKNSFASKAFRWINKHLIAWSISDTKKRALMSPSYDIGCKRATPSDTYYKAINSSKLTINDGNIERVEGTTIHSKDGTSRKVDVLILATGFKTNSPYCEIDIKNLEKEHLDKVFHTPGRVPSIKYGITYAKMPNFFQIYGPTTNLGHSSIIWMLECQASYTVKLIQKMEQHSIKSIELKEEVGKEYWKWIQERMKSTVWSSNCGSWYQNANGEVVASWPGTTLSYYWHTLNPKLSDYHCTSI